MILDELKESILSMNEIQQLEQVSKDSQRQERADSIFSSEIVENSNIVHTIDGFHGYVEFVPSALLIQYLRKVLSDSQECIRMGLVQEDKIKILQTETKMIRECLMAEWETFYNGISERRVTMLTTVKEITPNKDKTRYAITKIKSGAAVNFNSTDKVRLLAEGIAEADMILEGLGLTEEIMQFLDKVSEGRATIGDLTDSVMRWIREENLINKFIVKFGM